jgi:hypothetical protein
VTLLQFLPIDERNRKSAYRTFAAYFLKRGVPEDVLIRELVSNGASNAADVVPDIRQRLAQSDDRVHAFLGHRIVQAYTEQFGVAGYLPFLSEAELLAEQPAPFVVDGVIVQGSLFMIFAPKNMGKTFLSFDLGYRMATGNPTFLGRRIRQHGHVAMVLAEGGSRLNVRAQAWRDANRFTDSADVSFLKRPVDLRDDTAIGALIATIAARNPKLIILDTLSRNLPGAVENSAEDMTRAVAACDRMRSEMPGVTIGVMHHPTKANDDVERGSSVFAGAVDTVMSVKLEQGVRVLWCKYQRDAEPFEPIPFELATVNVPTYRDDDGNALTSCVIRHLTADQVAQARDANGTLQNAILSRLQSRPMSGSELETDLQKKRRNVQDACRELETAKRIEQVGTGPRRKWKLARNIRLVETGDEL